MSTMDDLLPVDSVTIDDVRTVMRDALRVRGGAALMADYLARVDWSTSDRAAPEVTDLLGKIEQLSTDFDEENIEAAELISEMIGLLPPAETVSVLIVMGGTEVTLANVDKDTIRLVDQDPGSSGPGRLLQRPQKALSIQSPEPLVV